MSGVRVPYLNPVVWRYALLGAGDGAMVWRDEDGDVAAFNVAHRSGTEGWMGPLAVRADREGTGVGRRVVGAAGDALLDEGVTTLGLETMPRTVENIGFYARLGFTPGHLTVTVTNEIGTRGHRTPQLLSQLAAPDQPAMIAAAGALVSTLAPGYDFSREPLLPAELGLGDTTLVTGPAGGDAPGLGAPPPPPPGPPPPAPGRV